MQTSEDIVRFKSCKSDSQPSESVNRIATILYEVIPLIKHWDESDSHTLHTVYTFLNSIFIQVREHSYLQNETKKCILSLMKEVQNLKHDLEMYKLQRNSSAPEAMSVVLPHQESMRLDENEERCIASDSSASQSVSAPAEVGQFEQQKFLQLWELAGTVENNLGELWNEVSKNEPDDCSSLAEKDVLIASEATPL